MKRKILKKLESYSPKAKLNGKRALVYHRDEDNGHYTLYGTIEGRKQNSITIGDFIDIRMPMNYGEQVKTLHESGRYDEMHQKIRFAEEMHPARPVGETKTFELSDKVDCYVIEDA